jgi:hypothetical protein
MKNSPPQASWTQGLPLRVGLLRVPLTLHPGKPGQALHIPKPYSPAPAIAAIVTTSL